MRGLQGFPAAIALPELRSWTARRRISILAISIVALGVAGLLYFGVPVVHLPLILAGALVAVVSLRSPILGLGFVIAAQFAPMELGGFTVLQLLGALVAIVSVLWFGVSKRGIVISNMVPPMLVMFLLVLHSLTFTRDVPLTQYALRKLALNVIFCLLLINLVNTYKKLRYPLWMISLMAVWNSLAGVFQFLMGQVQESRAKGLQENEIHLGEVAAVAFAIPLYYFLYGDRRWKRLVGLGVCAVVSGGLVTSATRGAYLALAGGILFMLVRERRYWIKFLVLGGLALCVYPFIPGFLFHRLENLGQDIRGTVVITQRRGLSTRGYYNKGAIRIWKRYPVLGVGFGNFGYYFVQSEFNPGLRTSRQVPPHNIYVQALAEMGTVGFLVLCWWILQAAFNYWVAEKKTGDDPHQRICLRACETATLVTLITYFSQGNLVYTHLAMFLALSYVCRICAENLRRPQEGETA